MSDAYKGLCVSKNWTWKRITFQKDMQIYIQDLDIGTSRCLLQTQSPKGFSEVKSTMPEGIVGSYSGNEGTYSTKLSENRKVNIARFVALKSFAETFNEADKVILLSRKSSKQIQVLRCGMK